MLTTLLSLLFLPYIQGCAIQGMVPNITSSFTDTLFPRPLTIAETYAFIGTDCTYSITILQTVIAGGSAYYANQQQISSQSTQVVVTFEYPSLTMTRLASVGRTIDWVESWIGGPGGGGTYTILLPQPASAIPVSTTSSSSIPTAATSSSIITPTSTSGTPTTTENSQSSSALTTAEIGGIAGGVVGGVAFLAIFFYYLWRKLRRLPPPPGPLVEDIAPPYYKSPEPQVVDVSRTVSINSFDSDAVARMSLGSESSSGVEEIPRRRNPVEMEQAGGRLGPIRE